MSLVALQECSDYDLHRVEDAIEAVVQQLGGLGHYISTGARVLLKPNLLAARPPEDAVTTHPSILEALVKLVRKSGGIPFIADTPGYIEATGMKRLLQVTGLQNLGERLEVPVTSLGTKGYRKVKQPFFRILEEVHLATDALDADVIINLPKLKTHSQTGLTAAMKNCFGLVAPKERIQIHGYGKHPRFQQAMVEIYLASKPTLTVMDAIWGMEGAGPSQGTPRLVGLVLASPDALSVDECALGLTQLPEKTVPMIRIASGYRQELGDYSPFELPQGKTLKPLSSPFRAATGLTDRVPSFMTQLASQYIWQRPRVNPKRCTTCEACAKVCPVRAITMNPLPVVNDRLCIECHCCHELCPESAMELKKSWLARQF